MDNLVEIFCDVDDFCRFFTPQWEQFCLDSGHRLRCRQGHMSPCEIMTILILFHWSHYRDFKYFYLEHIWKYHHYDFPSLLSYSRFVSVSRLKQWNSRILKHCVAPDSSWWSNAPRLPINSGRSSLSRV